MKLKDLKPKYNTIELIASNKEGDRFKLIGLLPFKIILKREYKESEIYSIKDYADTKTTSVIIEDKEEYKGLIFDFKKRGSKVC